MTHRLPHLLLLGAIAAGVVAAALAAADEVRAALAVLALGLSALAAGLGSGLGHLAGRIDRLRTEVRSDLAGAARRQRRAGMTKADRAGLDRIDRRTEQIYARTVRLGTAVERVPSETVNIARFQDELAPGLTSMPALGGWAASAPSILYLVETVLSDQRTPFVVECGSGTSTVWIGTALRHRGSGRVLALEHDLHYAEQSRRDLARHGLSDVATVLDAPIVEHELPGGRAPWYDISGLAGAEQITLLFVDGPPADTASHARQPALEVLGDRLADGALVVLDDTDRAEEREILEAWVAGSVGGRAVEVVGSVGRSTVLRVGGSGA